jgi:hypothetical protein
MSSFSINNASVDAPATPRASQTSGNTTKKNLNEFPAEIRDEIFTLVLSEPWGGRIPGLIKVLRGDSKLYPEVITMFTQLQKFKITQGGWSNIKGISPEAASTIKSVVFYVT